MAILGTFIDKTVGVTLLGATTTTLNHSLNTTPDEVRFAMRSVASATTVSIATGLGGNASLSTIYAPSVLGAAAVFGDVLAVYYFSAIR